MQMSKAYPQSTSLCEPTTVSEVAGGGGTEVTCCHAGTKICCARLDQACSFPKKEAGIAQMSRLNSNALPIRSMPDLHSLKAPPGLLPLCSRPSFKFLTVCFYLGDDSRPDLQGLNGGGLSDQRHGSLHSNRVTCWFGWIGGDSCWERERQQFN